MKHVNNVYSSKRERGEGHHVGKSPEGEQRYSKQLGQGETKTRNRGGSSQAFVGLFTLYSECDELDIIHEMDNKWSNE